MASASITDLTHINQNQTGPHLQGPLVNLKKRRLDEPLRLHKRKHRKKHNIVPQSERFLNIGSHGELKVKVPLIKSRRCNNIDNLGWIPLPRGCNITRTQNPYVRSLRKLFREHKSKLYANGTKLCTLPARDTEIAKAFSYMNMIENYISIRELDPKIINKLVYMVRVMGCGINKPEDVTLEYYRKNIGHSYVKPLEPGGDRYNKIQGLMDDKHLLEVVESGGNCTQEIMTIIQNEIDTFGGFEAYCRVCSMNRPDAISTITKVGKTYNVEPVDHLMPIKVCQICGQINVYTRHPCTTNEIHKSLAHMRPDLKLYEWKPCGDENPDLPTVDEPRWRCCGCHADLNITVSGMVRQLIKWVSFIWKYCFKIMGQIEELMTMKYGDIYYDLDNDKKAMIKTHDLAVVNDYFFHLRRKIVNCGHDLDPTCQRDILKYDKAIWFKRKSGLNNIKPELIAEISVANELMKNLFSEFEVAIIGDVLPHTGESNCHQWYYNDYFFAGDTEDVCCKTFVCGHTGPFTIVGGLATLDMPISSILDVVDVQRNIVYIAPNRNDTSHLNDGTGLFVEDGENLLLFIDGRTDGFKMRLDTYNTLTNYDVIVNSNNYYLVTKIKQFKLVSVYQLTGPFQALSAIPKYKSITVDGKIVEIPLPNIKKFLGGWTNLSYDMHKFELDIGLFRYLCIRNLSGKLSHQSLKEHAVGYSMRRFTVHNKVIANPHIEYQIIDVHIIMCRMCMLILRDNYKTNFEFQKFLQFIGPFKPLLVGLDPIITGVALNCLFDIIKCTLGIDADTLIKTIKINHISTWVNQLCDREFWNDLLLLADRVELSELKTIDVSSTTSYYIKNIRKFCNHHDKHDEKHREEKHLQHCKCCGFKIAIDSYCECCAPEHKEVDPFMPSKWAIDESEHGDSVKTLIRNVRIPTESDPLFVEKLSNLLIDEQHAEPELESGKQEKPIIDEVLKQPDLKGDWKEKHKKISEQPVGVKSSEKESQVVKQLEKSKIMRTPLAKDLPLKPASELTTDESMTLREKLKSEKERKADLAAKEAADYKSLAKDIELEIPESSRSDLQETTESVTEPVDESQWQLVSRSRLSRHSMMGSQHMTLIAQSVSDVTDKDLPARCLATLKPNFISHVLYTVDYENKLNDGINDPIYILPHMKMGITILNAGDFEVVKTRKLPNTGINTCALDAYNDVFNMTLTEEETSIMVNRSPPYTDFSLNILAEFFNNNLIIISSSKVEISRYNGDSDEYGVIKFYLPTECGQPVDGIGHFEPAIIKRVSANEGYFCHGYFNNIQDREDCYKALTKTSLFLTQPGRIGIETNLKVELMLHMAMQEHGEAKSVLKLKVIKEQDGNYITNNANTKVHNVNAGYIHIKIPTHLNNLVGRIEACLNHELTLQELPDMFHVGEELPNDWHETINDIICEILRVMVNIQSINMNDQKKLIKNVITGKFVPYGVMTKFKQSGGINLKLKPGDVTPVKIGINKIEHAHVVAVHGNDVILDRRVDRDIAGKLFELKVSYASQVRNLIALMKTPIPMEVFKRILDNSQTVLGPAGFGKSTAIAEAYQPGDLCIAMTHTSVESLKEKLKVKSAVMSVEKAKYTHTSTNQTLYVDECTMVDWVSLLMVCDKNTKLRLYGSKNQIGYVDMSSTAGVRHSMGILKYLKPSQIKYSNVTYRIGKPLLDFLEPLEPGWTNPTNHRTTYNITCITDTQFNIISTICNRCKPNVVITTYNHVKKRLEETLTDTNIPVVTTHSFQGREVQRSVVVLAADWNGKWEKNAEKEWLNSALTRAKDHVEIVLVDKTILNKNSVSELLAQIGGVNWLMTKLFEDNTREEITNQVINMAETSGVDFVEKIKTTNIENMNRLTLEDIKTLNTMDISYDGIKPIYKKIDNGVECVCKLKGLGSEIAKITNINGNVTVEANEVIKRRIMKNMTTCVALTPDDEKLLAGGRRFKAYLHIKTLNKIRELAWIVDKTIDGEMEIMINNKLLHITKTKGCPLLAGLIISCETEYISISDGWENFYMRNVTTNITDFITYLNEVIQWLDMEVPGLPEQEYVNISWLSYITGDMMSAIWQAQERLGNVHIWLLNAITMDETPKCITLNQQNTALMNRIIRKLKLGQPITNHQSVIPHKTLIIKTDKWFKGLTYKLVNENGQLCQLHSAKPSNYIIEFLIEAMQDMKHIKSEGIKGINLNDLEIPGLIMDLKTHFSTGTEIRKTCIKHLIELDIPSNRMGFDTIKLSDQTIAKYGKQVKDKFPYFVLSKANYTLPCDDLTIMLENVMVNCLSSIKKTTKKLVVYGGPLPMCVAIQGKYYVKIRVPGLAECDRYLYDQQYLQVEALVAQFIKYKDINVLDLKWNETDKATKLMLGTSIYTLTDNEIKLMLEKAKYIFGWLPLSMTYKSKYYRINKYNRTISYQHAEYTKSIRNNLIEAANSGTPLYVNENGDSYYEICTLFELLDHRLIVLKNQQTPGNGTVSKCIGTNQDLVGTITVKVPWLSFSISDVVISNALISSKTLIVSKPLLRNMLLRLATGDDSEDSILAYARTLESTQIITESNIQDMYATEIPTLMATAWMALYIHNDYLSKFKYIIQLINLAADSRTMRLMLEHIVPGTLKLMHSASIVSESIIKPIVDRLTSILNESRVSITPEDLNPDFSWLMYTPKRKLIKYKIKPGRTEGPFHGDMIDSDDDGDSDDDADDKNYQPKWKYDINKQESYDKTIESDNSRVDRITKQEEPTQTNLGVNTENITEGMITSCSSDESEETLYEINQQSHMTHTVKSQPDEESDAYQSATEEIEIKNDDEEMEKPPDDEAVKEAIGKIITDKPEKSQEESVTGEASGEHVSIIDTATSKKIFDELKVDKLEEFGELLLKISEELKNIKDEELYKQTVENLRQTVSTWFTENGGATEMEINQLVTDVIIKDKDHIKLIQILTNAVKQQELSDIDLDLSEILTNGDEKYGNPQYRRHGSRIIPLIIWTYWDVDPVPKFIQGCFNTWHKHNGNYRIVCLTNKTLHLLFNTEQLNVCAGITPQLRSDYIRLAALATYGGIWLDASSIAIESFDSLVEEVLHNQTGSFFYTLTWREQAWKYYEVWLITCTTNNNFMKQWYDIFNDMVLNTGNDGGKALRYLKEVYGRDIFEQAIQPIWYLLREYLRINVTQNITMILNNMTELDCTCNGEGVITTWHMGFDWLNIWETNAHPPKEPKVVTIQVVKLIGQIRQGILDGYRAGKVPKRGSYVAEIHSNTKIWYDLYDIHNLIKPAIHQINEPKKLAITLDSGIDCLLLGMGSIGDIAPLIRMYDMLLTMALKPIIVTHKDLEPYIANRKCILLRKTSRELMEIAKDIQYKHKYGATVTGYNFCKEFCQQTVKCIMPYSNRIKLTIITAMFPCREYFKPLIGGLWCVTNPFPIEWATGKPPTTSTTDWVRNEIAKFALKSSDMLITELHLPKLNNKLNWRQGKTIYTMDKNLLSIAGNDLQLGSLTLNGMTTKEAIEFNNDNDIIVINLGSCDLSLPVKTLLGIIKSMIMMKLNVIYIDKFGRVKPGSFLHGITNQYKDKLKVLRQFSPSEFIGAKLCLTHGGIGTLTDCVFNGIIPIIYHTIADQAYWAERVEELGIGASCGANDIIQQISETMNKSQRYKRSIDFLKVRLKTEQHLFREYINKEIKSTIDVRLVSMNTVNLAVMWYGTANTQHSRHAEVLEDKGIFKVMSMATQVIYNPGENFGCVGKCINKFINDEVTMKPDMSAIKPIINLYEPCTNRQIIINGVLSLGFNLLLEHDNYETIYINCFDGPTIALRVIEVDYNYHCQLMRIVKLTDYESVMTSIKTVDFLNETLHYMAKFLKITYNYLELCDVATLIRTNKPIKWKDYMARIKLNSLTQLARRSDLHVTMVNLVRDRNCYRGDIIHPDTGLMLFLCTGESGWVTASAIIYMNSIYLFSDFELTKLCIVINLHMKLSDDQPIKTVINEQNLISLNQETVNYCTTKLKEIRSNHILRMGKEPYTIIIAHYDNRSHHNTNEREKIMQAQEAIIYSNQDVKLSQFEETYNQSVNRLILQQGKLMYCCEFSDMHHARILQSILPYGQVIGSSLLTNEPITGESLIMLNRWYTKINPKLIPKYSMNLSKERMIRVNGLISLINGMSIAGEDREGIKMELISQFKTGEVKITPLNKLHTVIVKSDMKWLVIDRDGNGMIPALNISILIPMVGAGEVDTIWWKESKPDKLYSKAGDWWGIKSKFDEGAIKTSVNDRNTPPLTDVMAINNMVYHEIDSITSKSQTTMLLNETCFDIYIAPYSEIYSGSKLEPLYDFVPSHVRNLWEDGDLTNWLTQYAPMNKSKTFTREHPGKIKIVEKHTLTKYPTQSRPVLTRVCFEESRSIMGRMKSVAHIRTIKVNPLDIAFKVANTYFSNDWQSMSQCFKSNPIIVEPEHVRKWIIEKKNCPQVVKELINDLAGEILIKPISDVKIHLKLESLLKEQPIKTMRQQQARIIVWQRYAVCAMFSSVFIEAKKRFKSLLHRKIVYADGLRPDEIAARTRLCNNVVGFFENDLSKQDRQTDSLIIDTEMLIYELLGVHPNVLGAWREVHEQWRFKSDHLWGTGEAMRLTGQATTALGNCITNLQVHEEFTRTNWNNLELALFLGDDMCMIFNSKPDIRNLRNDIACRFNMQSKESWQQDYGNFCSMVVAKAVPNRCELCPDVVRLGFRYEVTNGAHEVTSENLQMRNNSYLSMIGDHPWANKIIEKKTLPIKPVKWYSHNNMINALKSKYNMNEFQVEGYFHKLLDLIDKTDVTTHQFRIFTNK